MKSLQISFLRGWRLFFLLYALLLVVSFIFEHYKAESEPLLVGLENVSKDSDTLLFLPDMEGSNTEFYKLKTELSKNYSIVSVNYSGIQFNNDSYSADRYAEKISEELSSFGIEDFHIIASGFGSVIAAELANDRSQNNQSLVLYDPEGILEFELLGGHQLNKGVYYVGSLIGLGLEYLTPDFGFFERSGFSYKNFKTRLDTDLRDSRTSFSRILVPTLIVNSSNNFSTDISIAEELDRIIITSKLEDSANSKDSIASSIQNFLENSTAHTKDVSISDQVKSKLPFSNSKIVPAEGWLLTGLMLLIIFSTFFSEDLACIGAGLMVARGLMGFFPAVAASFIGIFVGDILIYVSGRWLGLSAVQKAPFKWFVSSADIQRSNEWFKAKGPAIILISRFIPGTRFPTYFSAGVIGASFFMFITYFGIASLIWTPILVGAAVFLGQELIFYFSIYQEYALVVLGAVVISALITLKVIIPLFTYKGRRLLYGKYKRLVKWEFWHPFVLYTPVIIYTLYLWIRYKKITKVTAANPVIEEGGFIGESKSDILNNVAATEYVAKHHFLDVSKTDEELLKESHSFMVAQKLDFPIVLKPDKGERGSGVQIIKSQEELNLNIRSLSENTILQEFIEGDEFGIFYYKHPNNLKGEIFSITIKKKISVIGDGIHTLEELILQDSRAVCMAEIHFKKHASDLYTIPENGKKVELVELGTHSRGSLFLDGAHLITEKLTDKIEQISNSFEGFYFGRYDVKVNSESDLTNGEGIKVIEINGVTSESTNIYDPKHSFAFAVKTLIKQWKIAFEIGEQNYQSGATIPSLKHMLRLIINN